ncbi:hypothetical protein BKA62DRAFT_692711 [Auriculariales sp. MPI-PUGE-AT-0066]|nr:hypothetical protein BKA62DRAFT_692711 [Auriculariales sp. MPI-PUGE-AT-0066]
MNSHEPDYRYAQCSGLCCGLTTLLEEQPREWPPTIASTHVVDRECLTFCSPLPSAREVEILNWVQPPQEVPVDAVSPWNLSCMLAPSAMVASTGLSAYTSGDTSPSTYSYSTPPTFPSSYSASGISSPRLTGINTVPFPTIAEEDFILDDFLQEYPPSTHSSVNSSQELPPLSDNRTPARYAIHPYMSLSFNQPHSFMFTAPLLPAYADAECSAHISPMPQVAAKAASSVPTTSPVRAPQRRAPSLEHRGRMPSSRLGPRSTSASLTHERTRSLPPRALELRILNRAEIARLSSTDRHEIYVASLQAHVSSLVTTLLACPKYERNVLNIEQLAEIDAKTTHRRVIDLYRKLNMLEERVKILRVTHQSLRGRTPEPKPLSPFVSPVPVTAKP